MLNLLGIMLASTPGTAPPSDDTTVVYGQHAHSEAPRGRAVGKTTRKEIEERAPQSTPEALAFTPGVYVQQTAHGQASVYIRGRTGQQTLLLFDGLRINHALFRQGPNQYLFTVDLNTVDALEVVRGSASVELGADAMSGAVLIQPLEPRIDRTRGGLRARPKLIGRHATSSRMLGGRAQLDTQIGASTGVLAGVGYRTAGRLEASGPVSGVARHSAVPDFEYEVPTFAADGRHQLGTGFDELTADARVVHRLSGDDALTAALYVYRQYDAPRTDQCPPPEAPLTDCLKYDEQFRTLAYAKAELSPGMAALNHVRASVGYQRQHERRTNARPESFVESGGRDAVSAWLARARAEIRPTPLVEPLALELAYGFDASHETVDSAAWVTFLDLDFTRRRSRGQYLDGSRYVRGGAWASPTLVVGRTLRARAGGRVAFATASAPADAGTSTAAVDQSWTAAVGNAGLEWRPAPSLRLLASAEQGFRPPNLDDLTARQPTGRGFQLENPDLVPERALTLEVGACWETRRLHLAAFVFRQTVDDLIERRAAPCPPGDRECAGARAAIQLVNLPATAQIVGAEGEAKARLPAGFTARATIAWARGESDTPVEGDTGRVPISRIPPLNGVADLRWRDLDTGLFVGGTLRWARAQDRLSVGDVADARIPPGGTPGYAVVDLRAGLRLPGALLIAAVLENIGDVPYRAHGSSVNGRARGLALTLEYVPPALDIE